MERKIDKEEMEDIVQSGIYNIDLMSGEEFEIFLEYLFKKLGYKVIKRTKLTNDYGAVSVIMNCIIHVQ